MRIPCTVFGHSAFVVGYAQGKKAKPMAIVIMLGKLQAVKLKHIDLGKLPEELGVGAKVVPIPQGASMPKAGNSR